MKDPMSAVADGLRILRNDRAERVQAHGIPVHLLSQAAEIGQEIQTKVSRALAFYQRGYRAFLLTGPESPQKDVLAVSILCGLMGSGRLVRYYMAATFDEHDAGDCAMMGVDQVKGLQAIKVRQFLYSHVGADKTAIIGGASADAIEEALESSIMDYLAHRAIEIECDFARPRIPKV